MISYKKLIGLLFVLCINKYSVEAILKTKLLVSTGSPVDNGVVSEVLDLQNATNICSPMSDFPIKTSQGTGAVLDSNTNYPSALICAGVYSDECHIVGGGNDIAASKLNTQRRFASSMLIDPAILWITGGLTPNPDFPVDITLSSTEFVSLRYPNVNQFGPELPVPTWGHCIVQLNESSAMLIGGRPLGKSTYIIDFATEKWTEGPPMDYDRYLHQCATFKSMNHGDREVIVAVGGYSTELGMLDTVEIFDVMDGEWLEVTSLPKSLAEFSLVTNPTGDGVLAIGGINGSDRQSAIYELFCNRFRCMWYELDQKLEYPRMNHVAMLIPDDLATC